MSIVLWMVVFMNIVLGMVVFMTIVLGMVVFMTIFLGMVVSMSIVLGTVVLKDCCLPDLKNGWWFFEMTKKYSRDGRSRECYSRDCCFYEFCHRDGRTLDI